jgi:hypothetical protein
MIRIVLGSIVGGAVMFVVGFIFWATPLSRLAYGHAEEAQSAAVQLALAQNLPHTGRFIVPDPGTAQGTVLYGRGPVATVDYNTAGASASNSGSMLIGGYVQEVVVVLLLGLALWPILGRVPDFASRARVAVGVSAAATVMIELANPIFNHGPWGFAIYATIADLCMLTAAALVLARWFLPAARPVAGVEPGVR